MLKNGIFTSISACRDVISLSTPSFEPLAFLSAACEIKSFAESIFHKWIKQEMEYQTILLNNILIPLDA